MFPEPVHETQGRVELARDTSPARWIEQSLPSWINDAIHVRAIVPAGFEAYARLFHPAQHKPEDGGEPIRWSTIASWTGRVVHPEMQFHRIANLADPNDYPGWGYRPQEGMLPRDDCDQLAALLRPFTSTPDLCWFCIWDGFGQLDPRRYKGVPRVTTPGRSYLLYRGPLNAVTSFHWDWMWQSPNLWWPDDHAWCVASEIDLLETYIGGSDRCIEAILVADRLEVMRTHLDARVDAGGDRLNPPAG